MEDYWLCVENLDLYWFKGQIYQPVQVLMIDGVEKPLFCCEGVKTTIRQSNHFVKFHFNVDEIIKAQDDVFSLAKKLGFKVNGLFITGNESKHWSQLKRFVDNNPRLGMASMKLVDGEIIVRKNYKEI